MRYLCYDSALNEVYTLLLLQKEYVKHVSLFNGTKDEQLWHVAPWLFQITEENFYKKWDDPNCHLKRCLILESLSNLQDLKAHLQQFLYKQINRTDHFNRFWDAIVLSEQLDRMDAKERAAFFEEIEAIYVQHEKGFLKYTLDKRERLLKQMITEQELFGGTGLPSMTKEEKVDEPQTETKPRRKFFIE